MDQNGGRHATNDVQNLGIAALRALPVIGGARRDRASKGAGPFHTGDWAPPQAGRLDTFLWTAAQRGHPQRRVGVSGDDRAVACRSVGPSAETNQACAQPGLAHVCGEEACRRCLGPERRSRSWSRSSVEGPPAWSAKGSAMGQGMEPEAADCSTPADRPPGRQDHAHQPRSHLSGPLCSGPRGAAPRTDGLLADGTRVTGAEGARTPVRQRLYLAGDHDHSTAYRSDRSSGAGALRGRPHPRSW